MFRVTEKKLQNLKGSKGSKKLFQKNKIVKQQEQQQYFSSLSSRLKLND